MSNPIVDPLVEEPDTTPAPDLVQLESTVEGAVTVVLNRPAKKNAFDANLISALTDTFETLQGAEHVRVVFLKGAGGTFSTGADLDWMRSALDSSESENRDDALGLAKMLKALWDLPQLTVALVEGAAFGGGIGLVAACDMAVATADATFCFAETRLGLTPATISPYAIQAIGPRTARGLFATAKVFDAAYAEKIGLVTEVAADATALSAVAGKIAAEIVACSPVAVAAAKDLVAYVTGRPIDHYLVDETAKRIAAARVSENGQEGIRAFLDGRKPSWASLD